METLEQQVRRRLYRGASAARLTIGPPAGGSLIVADRPLKALVKRLRQPGTAVLVLAV